MCWTHFLCTSSETFRCNVIIELITESWAIVINAVKLWSACEYLCLCISQQQSNSQSLSWTASKILYVLSLCLAPPPGRMSIGTCLDRLCINPAQTNMCFYDSSSSDRDRIRTSSFITQKSFRDACTQSVRWAHGGSTLTGADEALDLNYDRERS